MLRLKDRTAEIKTAAAPTGPDPLLELAGPGRVPRQGIGEALQMGSCFGSMLGMIVSPGLPSAIRRSLAAVVGAEFVIFVVMLMGAALGVAVAWLVERRLQPGWLVFDRENLAMVLRDRVVFQSRWDELRWERTGLLVRSWQPIDPLGRPLRLGWLDSRSPSRDLSILQRAFRWRAARLPRATRRLSGVQVAMWVGCTALMLVASGMWRVPMEQGDIGAVMLWVALTCLGAIGFVVGLGFVGPITLEVSMRTLARWGMGGGPPPPGLPRHVREMPAGVWMEVQAPARALPSARDAWFPFVFCVLLGVLALFVAVEREGGWIVFGIFLAMGTFCAVAAVSQANGWRRRVGDRVMLLEDGRLVVRTSDAEFVLDRVTLRRSYPAFAELGSCMQVWRGKRCRYPIDPRYLVEVVDPLAPGDGAQGAALSGR